MSDKTKRPSVYARGADDGLVMGGILSALILCVGWSSSYPVAAWPALAGMIAVPFVAYRMLRRSDAVDNYNASFSALWLHGICIFFFGSLLMAAVTFVCLRYIAPDYIATRVDEAATLLDAANVDGGADYARALRTMAKEHLLPTPIQVAMELLWLGAFSGSILSMGLAAFVRGKRKITNN